jgi:segregation and condensation protein A
MTKVFEVELDKFSGPLQLLLELIEQEELPITEVSLAQVTDDFLKYINTHKVPAEELADFLIVATRLLLIKSKAILPTLEFDEEEDTSKLALQLKMYKEFVNASKGIEELFMAPAYLFAREKQVQLQKEEFAPPENATDIEMVRTFKALLKRLEPFFSLQQESMERVVSVHQRIGELREAILERSRMTFRQAVKGAKSKVDVVVSFLALLELVKQQIVSVSQDKTFSDINISHVD